MASEIQIRKKAMIKAYRSQVRLAYALQADAEIERNVEEVAAKIEMALNCGQDVRLTPAVLTISGEAVAIGEPA